MSSSSRQSLSSSKSTTGQLPQASNLYAGSSPDSMSNDESDSEHAHKVNGPVKPSVLRERRGSNWGTINEKGVYDHLHYFFANIDGSKACVNELSSC